LGYSWDSNQNNPGVTNGYIGIGFDEWGNYSTSTFGSCTNGCPSRTPNSVTIRGSGNLFEPGFEYLTRANANIGAASRAEAKTVRINITPAPTVKITIQIDSGSGFETIINEYDLTTATNQSDVPATFKMGFSGGTGGLNNYHEIRNLNVIETADTGDGPPSVSVSVPADTEVLTVVPNQLVVTFNEDVSLATATNTDNYILLEAKGDSGFESGDCDAILNGVGVAATDTRIPIIEAAYPTGDCTSTLTLGSALTEGTYRLLVCGTTSIEDLMGNELNGGLSDAQLNFMIQAGAVPGPAAGTAARPAAESTSASESTSESESESISKPAPAALPATGFPQGRFTSLPTQPESKAYTEAAMLLDIPIINVRMPIVGVPQSEDSWDVTWLGNNAGYLAGSAFPTWSGNSVLTGHVWDAYNQPGPFAELKSLKYGDQFYIYAWDQTFTYEVRENKLLLPNQISQAFQHEDRDWVTLLTCENYNPFQGSYHLRRAIRAVLSSVE
jgi:LPXTG-site transpeptidase (sortase) family protein